MSVLQRIRGLVDGRGLSYQDVWGADWQAPANTYAGVTVTQEGALAVGAVYACVRLIAENIASLPLDAFEKVGGARRELDPTPSWIHEPNLEQDRFDWIESYFTSLLLDGNAFVLVLRDDVGDPLELWVLHPGAVKCGRDSLGLYYDVTDASSAQVHRLRRYTPTGGHIWHTPAFRIPGTLRGVNPIEKARQALGLALAAEEYGARFFANDARAGGVIEIPADKKHDDEDVRRMLTSWRQKHQGRAKAHTPGVLTGGATWKQITLAPEEAQFLETRRQSVADVARLFRAPPHMIGDVERSTSWGTGIEEQTLGFVTWTLRPWLTRFELSASRLLAPARGRFVRFNVEGLLRARTLDRFRAHAIARQTGWKNVDEIRADEDMPPLADGAGGVYLDPANMLPSGQLSGEMTLQQKLAALVELVKAGFDPAGTATMLGVDLPPLATDPPPQDE